MESTVKHMCNKVKGFFSFLKKTAARDVRGKNIPTSAPKKLHPRRRNSATRRNVNGAVYDPRFTLGRRHTVVGGIVRRAGKAIKNPRFLCEVV